VIAVFQVESNFRGDFSICFGVEDTVSPRKSKRFLNYPNLMYGGYYTTFPASEIVFDLTEFLPINNEDLFMQIDDGGSNRSLKVNKFSVEIYNDYSSSPVQTLNDTTLPVLTKDGSTSRFILKDLTVAANTPLTKMVASGYEIASRPLTSDDLESYISCPARMPKEKFQKLVSENRIKILDRVLLSNSNLGKINATAVVDNSKSVYSPPIGSQEQKGSCTAWALGYYLATYNMAKVKEWDLSGAR
jgi:hypothetical protein